MMPPNDPLEWHRRALAGESLPITTTPECGWFLQKNGKGSFLPASIYWERQVDENGEIIGDDILRAEVGGAARDPEEIWPWLAKRPISKSEYDKYLEAMF